MNTVENTGGCEIPRAKIQAIETLVAARLEGIVGCHISMAKSMVMRALGLEPEEPQWMDALSPTGNRHARRAATARLRRSA